MLLGMFGLNPSPYLVGRPSADVEAARRNADAERKQQMENRKHVENGPGRQKLQELC